MNTINEVWLIALAVVFVVVIALLIYGAVRLWKWVSK